jgi:hypothetical protein
MITNESLRGIAIKYRNQEVFGEHFRAGYVTIVRGEAVGIFELLEPHKFEPGAYAVSEEGKIFVAHGGNPTTGAAEWRERVDAIGPEKLEQTADVLEKALYWLYLDMKYFETANIPHAELKAFIKASIEFLVTVKPSGRRLHDELE